MKILNFYTQACIPCKPLDKILEKVDIEVESINALEDIAKVDEYNICTVPTLIFLNNDNKEIARTIGLKTLAEIQDIIKYGH